MVLEEGWRGGVIEEDWISLLRDLITRPEQITERFKIDVKPLKAVVSVYPMRVSRYYFNLIEEVGDPIWMQCIPSPLELTDPYGFLDPLNEEGDSPVPGLVHRYPDRVLMCVSTVCATYCRFCTRKRMVGRSPARLSMGEWAKQIEYIRGNPSIRDVLISGGDPFMLPDETLDRILGKVRAIPHVEIIRIGSRMPCTLPQRITPKLCNILKKYHPLYVNVHFNHPMEITEESERACGLLADVGIPLGNQSVLLRGVNDDPKVMKELLHKLLKVRVRPYYLFQMDLVRGASHFRTRVETGIKILESLIGYTSGLAIPRYVIDAPGGGGKIPIQPNYVVAFERDKVILRNYEGGIYVYPQPPLEEEENLAYATPP
ncbi:MAG: KamA family radical SAM protein [Nitrososphaerota archaeon]|nr:KamA family radical SAM protein [Candidatus Bathyarchaeota archaeon]MDW8062420.1 KamA family radical SAM protein [Nitrososphaerota archaeon]